MEKSAAVLFLANDSSQLRQFFNLDGQPFSEVFPIVRRKKNSFSLYARFFWNKQGSEKVGRSHTDKNQRKYGLFSQNLSVLFFLSIYFLSKKLKYAIGNELKASQQSVKIIQCIISRKDDMNRYLCFLIWISVQLCIFSQFSKKEKFLNFFLSFSKNLKFLF